jgi:hypothetical protein
VAANRGEGRLALVGDLTSSYPLGIATRHGILLKVCYGYAHKLLVPTCLAVIQILM